MNVVFISFSFLNAHLLLCLSFNDDRAKSLTPRTTAASRRGSRRTK